MYKKEGKMFKWEIELKNFIENKREYKVKVFPEKAIGRVVIKHLKCGRTFETTARKVKVAKCPQCYRYKGANRKKTNEEFVREVRDLYKGEYEVIGEYKNAISPVEVKHRKCGRKYETIPNLILTNSGCPYCYGREKLSHREFLKEVEELEGDEYTVMSEYKLSKYKIKMRHNKCSHVYLVTPNKFLMGRRCPKCRSSSGEIKIRRWLKRNKIKFISEYSFKDLKGKAGIPLRFDFLILNEDETIHSLIEFDGRQHFMPVDFFGGEEEYKEVVRRDKIKNRYCKKEGLKLLRISYKEVDMLEDILKCWVNKK